MPHGTCLLWERELVYLHAISDLLIALAYYSIPISLFYLVYRKRTVEYSSMMLLFGAFILACGTTHLMNIYTLFVPAYALEGGVKAATALVSVATALVLAPLVSRLLNQPTRAELAAAELERRNNELQRAIRDLEQFAYAASHDLQEPLRSVSGFLQILKRRHPLEPGAAELVDHAVDASVRMQQMIQDLLAYSRVGREGQPESFPLDDALDDALVALTATLEDTGAEIERDPLPRVRGVPSLLGQLFQNLLSNAIKFRGERRPHVRITARPVGDRWQISIRDNGIGFEPEHQDRIFQVFQRLHTREEYPGSGIGLSVVKKIVELHGGEIEVETAPERGTTFRFTLPPGESPR